MRLDERIDSRRDRTLADDGTLGVVSGRRSRSGSRRDGAGRADCAPVRSWPQVACANRPRSGIGTRSNRVKIRRAVVRVGGEFIICQPKSDAGVRDVAIPPHLIAYGERPPVRADARLRLAREAALFPAIPDSFDVMPNGGCRVAPCCGAACPGTDRTAVLRRGWVVQNMQDPSSKGARRRPVTAAVVLCVWLTRAGCVSGRA